MGILNKILFWRTDDEHDFDKLTANEMGKSELPIQDDLGLEEKSPFAGMPTGTQETQPLPSHLEEPGMPAEPLPKQPEIPSVGENKDFELINSKLDTLKVLLTSLDQRLANLEKSAGGEKKKEERLW